MRLPRFTIAGLMGLVVVVAVGVAAMRFASETWAGVLLMLTLGVLGAAVLAFHERSGPRRSWWRGFALFGWGYVALALGPWASEVVAPQLPTTAGLDALSARMHPAAKGIDATDTFSLSSSRIISSTVTPNGTTLVAAGTPPRTLVFTGAVANPPPASFSRVGHRLWALLVTCVGGGVGRALHASGERSPA
jgi:hypothetical protein